MDLTHTAQDENRRDDYVLIADDDDDIRALIATILSAYGMRTHTVSCGGAALAAWRTAPPRLGVLDVRMGDVDGLRVCREIRAAGDPTPILLVSAESDPSAIRAGYAAGCDDYLTKPFARRDLLRRVSDLLEGSMRTVYPYRSSAGPTQLDGSIPDGT